MTFSYAATIPSPPNDPADDVGTMQTNAGSISSIVAVDHVGFNVAGGGQHKQVTFNANNVPGSPTSPPVLFTNGTLPQLFYYSGTAAQSANQYVASTNGSTFLLGGIIVKWGSYTITGTNGSQAVTFAGGAFLNNAFSLIITTSSNPPSSQPGSYQYSYTGLSASGFTGTRIAAGTSTNQTYNYIAIGN